jgi:hypothetical protein
MSAPLNVTAGRLASSEEVGCTDEFTVAGENLPIFNAPLARTMAAMIKMTIAIATKAAGSRLRVVVLCIFPPLVFGLLPEWFPSLRTFWLEHTISTTNQRQIF